jgi:hypothetical protein
MAPPTPVTATTRTGSTKQRSRIKLARVIGHVERGSATFDQKNEGSDERGALLRSATPRRRNAAGTLLFPLRL